MESTCREKSARYFLPYLISDPTTKFDKGDVHLPNQSKLHCKNFMTQLLCSNTYNHMSTL